MLALFVLYLFTPGASPLQSGHNAVISRPCANSWNSAPVRKRKKRKGEAAELKVSAACIEISSSVLDVQEYLQSYVRKQQWKILNEDLNEDTWNFSLALNKDKLMESTQLDADSSKVNWSSGIAAVQAASTRLPDGFTRTIIRASFRGYGENQDQFAMQREYWDLPSNGKLEAYFVSVLREHFPGSS
jgi:hypothetical protein